ncbi:ABC transporter permease subunit [Thalassobacillus hwangdonensis]|uniref:ABC transporter permease subunit n=1 Tax=Thalassobacillus hwangdonensis TaxID=546108 RepID=A0ABW3L169_9BACI
MKNSIVRGVFYYLLGVVGILAISVAPYSLAERGVYNPFGYTVEFFKFVFNFFKPNSWSVHYTYESTPIFEIVWDPFVYSMQIFTSTLALGFGAAFILALIANFLPKFVLGFIKKLLNLFEAVPDLLIAFALQLLVVYIFKSSGVKIFEIVALDDKKIYLAPIITLAILPFISLFKILLLAIEEELLKDYVDFAKSKGLAYKGVLFFHILKNLLPSAFYHSKIILWASLSSLFIIERIYNMNGITQLIIEDFRPMVVAVSLLMIYTPFFFVFYVVDRWITEDERVGIPIVKKEKKDWRKWKVWPFLRQSFKVLVDHLKNVKFAAGFLFIFGVIVYSFLHSKFAETQVRQVRLHHNEDGSFAGAPPFPPGEGPFLFGSDMLGYSLFDQIVVGAKYTLLAALAIALLRILTGMFFGIFYAFRVQSDKQKWLEKIVDAMHFLPLSIIAYLLLKPILVQPTRPPFEWSTTLSERIFLEIVILTILVIPLTTVLVGNEIKQIKKQEFISSAKVLGGGNRHLLFRHILPHLGPRLAILFSQQFIQVLIIFVHLGFFDIFFGGTEKKVDGFMQDPPSSITYEWSGLIGATTDAIATGRYWMVLTVLVVFMLCIIAMQLIIQGIKEVQQVKVGVVYKKIKPAKEKKIIERSEAPATEEFTFVDSSKRHTS